MKNLNIFKGWSFVIFTVVFWHIYSNSLKSTYNMMLVESGDIFKAVWNITMGMLKPCK